MPGGGEFAEFVALLVHIVKALLDISLNLICFILLILALLLPWRLLAVVCGGEWPGWSQDEFRSWAVGQFCCSLADVVVLPLGLICLLWPPRWCILARRICNRIDRGDTYQQFNYNTNIRWALVYTFFESVADVPGVVLGLIALVCPWRTAIFLGKIAEQIKDGEHSDHDCCNDMLSSLRLIAAVQGIAALIDAPLFIWSLLSLLAPWRACAFVNVSFINRRLDEGCEDSLKVWTFWLWAPVLSLLDFLAGLLAVIALVNPIRAPGFVREFREEWSRAEDTTTTSSDFMWNPRLRQLCVRFGGLSLLDIFMLPMMIVVLVTYYRARPLVYALSPPCAASAPSDAETGADSHRSEAGQPSGAGALFQRFVGQGYTAAAVDSDSDLSECAECTVHVVTLRQFGLLCLDLLTLPFLLLVLITYYRWADTQERAWGEPSTGASNFGRLSYHCAVMYNAGVVLHDLVQLMFVTLLMITVYRAAPTWKQLRAREEGFRWRIWEQAGGFLLDLPLLPLLALLLVTLWRADLVLKDLWTAADDSERRFAVLWQTLYLLRDIVGFAATLVVAVTLVRLPGLALDLWAQRARASSGEPRFRISRATLLLAESSSNDRRPRLALWGQQAEARARADLGTVRMNIVSAQFWDEVGRVFGGALASLGRGLLPFALTDGKQLKFEEVLPQDAHIELRMGGREMKQRLNQLSPDINVCLQLEHQAPDGTEEVLIRVPLPLALLQQAGQNEGTELDLPEDLLEPDAALRVCGPLIEGVGVRDALWLCALKQLWQLLLDVFHVALMLSMLLAPWRLLACIRVLRGKEYAWTEAVVSRMLVLSAFKDDVLLNFRCVLEPVLNSTAKRHVEESIAFRHDGYRDSKSRVSSAEKAGLQALDEHPLPPRFLEKAAETDVKHVAPDLVLCFREHAALRDTLGTYWPSLAFGANLQHCVGALDPTEHAHSLELIKWTEECAAKQLSESASLLQTKASAFLEEAVKADTSSSGCCHKSVERQRALVRYFVSAAAGDWGLAALSILLLVTCYRVHAVVEDMKRSNGASLADRLRIAIYHQINLLARDISRLLGAACASALALVTVVRALDFLGEAFVYCSSLTDVRECGFRHSKVAFEHLWELFSLLFLWSTYRAALKGAVFGLLVPAYGLAFVPPRARLALWIALCTLPFFLPSPILLFIPAAGVSMIAFTVLLRGADDGSRFKGEKSPIAHVSWMNIFVLLGVGIEAVLLCDIGHSITTKLGTYVALKMGITFSCAWLVITAVPHSMSEDDGKACRSSIRYHVAVQFLRHCCLLPAVVAVLTPATTSASVASRLSMLLIMFVGVSAVLGLELQEFECSTLALKLDFVHPPMFVAGLFFTQLPLVVAEVLHIHGAFQVILAVLPFLWCWIYPSFIGWPGGPEWLPGFRQIIALAPFWCRLCSLALPALARGASLVGCVTLAICAVWYAVRAHRLGVEARQRAAKESGIFRVLRALGSKGSLLCFDAEASGMLSRDAVALADMDTTASAPALAAALEAFESRVRIERLSLDFLKSRRSWLEDLHRGSRSFASVASSARSLLTAVRTPPTSVLVIAALKTSGAAARRIPRPLWAMIMEFVGGVRPLTTLIAPILTHYREGEPKAQFMRARVNMKWCVGKLQMLKDAPCRSRNAAFLENGHLRNSSFDSEDDDMIATSLHPEPQHLGPGDSAADLPRSAEGVSADSQPDWARAEREAADWWQNAKEAFGRGCHCGRSTKPTDYCVFKPPFRIVCPLAPARYHSCCRGCARCGGDCNRFGGSHSRDCNRRTQQEPPLTIYRLGAEPFVFSAEGDAPPHDPVPAGVGADGTLHPDDVIQMPGNDATSMIPAPHRDTSGAVPTFASVPLRQPSVDMTIAAAPSAPQLSASGAVATFANESLRQPPFDATSLPVPSESHPGASGAESAGANDDFFSTCARFRAHEAVVSVSPPDLGGALATLPTDMAASSASACANDVSVTAAQPGASSAVATRASDSLRQPLLSADAMGEIVLEAERTPGRISPTRAESEINASQPGSFPVASCRQILTSPSLGSGMQIPSEDDDHVSMPPAISFAQRPSVATWLMPRTSAAACVATAKAE